MTATSGHGWSSHPPDHRRADDALGSKASSDKQQRRVGSCPIPAVRDSRGDRLSWVESRHSPAIGSRLGEP